MTDRLTEKEIEEIREGTEEEADDLPDGDWVMATGYDPPRGPYLAVSYDRHKGYRLIDANGETMGDHHNVRLATGEELRRGGHR